MYYIGASKRRTLLLELTKKEFNNGFERSNRSDDEILSERENGDISSGINSKIFKRNGRTDNQRHRIKEDVDINIDELQNRM